MSPHLPSPTVLLGALCLALGTMLVWRATTPPVAPSLPDVTPAARLAGITQPARLVPPDQGQFAEVSARPSFRPDRRPPRVAVITPPQVRMEAPPPPPPPMPPNVTLLGVMLGPAQAAAVVQPQGAPSARTVIVGDDVQGWRVQSIDADRILLRTGNVDHEVPLRPPANQRPGEGVVVQPPAAARTSRFHRQSGQRSRRSHRRTMPRR